MERTKGSIETVLRAIDEARVIAVIRRLGPEDVRDVTAALRAGGVTCIEVTMDSPGALASIEIISSEFPDVVPGAGTVLEPSEAEKVAHKGARFIVAPNVDREVIRAALDLGAVAIPGAMTPTEVVGALKAGAHLVKVFPASVVGLNFFRELKGPLPQVRTVATGGITAETAADYLRSGAYAVGLGGALVPKDAIAAKRFDVVEDIARKLTLGVRSALGR